MRILLIEDDVNKAIQLETFVRENFGSDLLNTNKSYQSGLKSLMIESYQLVILDMSLPNFDIKKGEDGYRFRKLGGVDILKEIKRKNISAKVIIVTQFESFGEGKDLIDLKSLNVKMAQSFVSIYMGTVYYNPSLDSWKNTLKELIIKVKKEYGQDTYS